MNVNSQFNGVLVDASLLLSVDSGRSMLPIYMLLPREGEKEETVLMLFMLEMRARGISKWPLVYLLSRLVGLGWVDC